MTVDIRNPRGKLFCIGFAVIFPANERVLKCNPTACFCKVIAACIENFKNKLEKYGINVTIRREMGADIDGACGQLRKSFIDKSNEQP